MGKKIEYTNGELTIVWQPELCQHAGICVRCYPMFIIPKKDPGCRLKMRQQKN